MTFISIIIFMLTFVLPVASHGNDAPMEYRVKANYLLNFPHFVKLPPHPPSCQAYTICVIGDTLVMDALEHLKGKQINSRPLAVKRIHDVGQMTCCQVLFIASSEQYRVQKILAEANARGILTVSDMRGFIRKGGMVNLVMVNNRITFDLNQAAARSASISFGTNLLKLANDVSN